MTLAQLIPLVFQVSMGLVVFSLALRANAGDLAYLLRRPGLLLRSLVAMSVLMPLAAILIARQFHLRPAVETALILLAESCSRPLRGWADSLQNSEIRGQRHLNNETRANFDRKKRASAFQKLIDQKFREAHPELFGSPDPDPPA